jgi:hypothetical protein
MTYFCDRGVEIPSSVTKREHTKNRSLKKYMKDSISHGKINREI